MRLLLDTSTAINLHLIPDSRIIDTFLRLVSHPYVSNSIYREILDKIGDTKITRKLIQIPVSKNMLRKYSKTRSLGIADLELIYLSEKEHNKLGQEWLRWI